LALAFLLPLDSVPHFDFGELEHDEDVFYTPDAREPQEHTCARAVLFLEWLNKVCSGDGGGGGFTIGETKTHTTF